jgi:hypothetical protein
MRPLVFFVSAGLLSISGCEGRPRDVYHYDVTVPGDWKPWSPSSSPPQAPGRILEAYEIPTPAGNGSLVIFRSGYLPQTTAAELLTQTRYLVLSLPSLRIEAAELIKIGDQSAVFLSAVAAGNGRELAPTGLGKPRFSGGAATIETRRIWVRVPRGPADGTLEVFFHCPEGEFGSLKSSWEAALASLKA